MKNYLNSKKDKRLNIGEKEQILVCLSASPSNMKVVTTASKMAKAFQCSLVALFVETPAFAHLEKSQKERLNDNIQYAKKLGANIETVYGEDVAFQIAEHARLSGISKIVIGRSILNKKQFYKKTVVDKLISIAPDLEIHIIPDLESVQPKHLHKHQWAISFSDILKSLIVLVFVTGICSLFHSWGFAEANIITVYVLGVLIISVITEHQIYSLLSSIVSVLLFNFMFTNPKFTFHAYGQGYPVTFVIMFIAAFLTGSLARRLKNQAKQSAKAAYRTKTLFESNQLFQQAKSKEEIIEATASQLLKLLDRNMFFYLIENDKIIKPQLFFAPSSKTKVGVLDETSLEITQWVFDNKQPAGFSTEHFKDSKYYYLPIKVNQSVYGVVGILMGEKHLDAFENSIILSILGECALALESEKNAREKEEATILAKNEQLRANILRTISHDLRTPLTSISGNASNLLSGENIFDDETKRQLYTDIYDDSMWLIRLVENLLSVSRIEEGRLNINICEELIDDVIEEALRHVNRQSIHHQIEVENDGELLFAKMDAKLIVQVIINIVDNAIKYTPAGSHIIIKTFKQDSWVVISIADDGDGISDEMKAHIFDMFYTGTKGIVDCQRSIGLGLSLCKAIINEHGGKIKVIDNKPKGTIFEFTLPMGEVKVYE